MPTRLTASLLAVFLFTTPLSLDSASAASAHHEAARISGTEFFDDVRGCPFVSANRRTFACLQHRRTQTSLKTWLAIVGDQGVVQERFAVYGGPATAPRTVFVNRRGVRAANRRLRAGGFRTMVRNPRVVMATGKLWLPTESARWSESKPRRGYLWKPPSIKHWPCLGPLTLNRAYQTFAPGTDEGSRSGHVVAVALRSDRGPSKCGGAFKKSEHLPDVYSFLRIPVDGTKPVGVPTEVRAPLVPVCRRLVRCTNALAGRPLWTPPQSGRSGTANGCKDAFATLRRQLPAGSLPPACRP